MGGCFTSEPNSWEVSLISRQYFSQPVVAGGTFVMSFKSLLLNCSVLLSLDQTQYLLAPSPTTSQLQFPCRMLVVHGMSHSLSKSTNHRHSNGSDSTSTGSITTKLKNFNSC